MKRFVTLAICAVMILGAGCAPFTNQAPVAYIDGIKPQPASVGQTVSFRGHGEDRDGRITSYQWRSDRDGQLSSQAEFETSLLSEGTHTVYFRVRDDRGTWSQEDIATLKVSPKSQAEPGIVIELLEASPSSIKPGETATLRWRVSGAARVIIEPGIGSVSLSGSRVVSPVTTTTYVLTALTDGHSSSVSTQVEVTGQKTLPIVEYFTATPTTIRRGETSTLRWKVSNAESVSVTSPGTVVGVALTGKGTVAPTQTSIYTLIASNAAGSVVETVQVVVRAASPQDTVILYSLQSEEGWVDESGNTGGPGPQAGDDGANRAYQGFLSFDLTRVPRDVTVVAASLDISSGRRTGDPFENLGPLRLYADRYGKLSPNDFSYSLPSKTLFVYGSRPVGAFTTSALRQAVQSAVDDGQRRFQVRMQFEVFTDGDYDADRYRMDAGSAVLVVTYE
jgi:hypothetical protein